MSRSWPGWIVCALAACGHGAGHGDVTADEIVVACANAFSCIPTDNSNRTVESCVSSSTGTTGLVSVYRPDEIHCLAAAHGDCSAALACIGYSVTPCTQDARECRGASTYVCSGGVAIEHDCSWGQYTPETTCVVNAVGMPTCAYPGTCTTDGGACGGTALLICSNNVWLVADCAPEGTCTTDATGGAACVADSPCTNRNSCDGTTLCNAVGMPIDCARILDGGTCVSSAFDPRFKQCGLASECAATTGGTCAGSALEMCVFGKPTTFDCVAAGFAGCNAGLCVPSPP